MIPKMWLVASWNCKLGSLARLGRKSTTGGGESAGAGGGCTRNDVRKKGKVQ